MSVALTPEQLDALIDGLDMQLPARRMNGTSAGDLLEQTDAKVRDMVRKERQNRRKRSERSRRARTERVEKATPKELTDEQRTDSWRIVGPLWPVIERVVKAKTRQANRYGSHAQADDVIGEVTDRMYYAVHTSKFEVVELAEAAHDLADAGELTRESKGTARKWLLSVLNRITQRVLYEFDVQARGVLSLDDLRQTEAIADALRRMDDHYNAFTAGGGCRLDGYRYLAPGQTDVLPLLFAVATSITDRGLDDMARVILDNLRSDGSVAWRACAREVFEADPAFEGAWDAVERATSGMADPDARRAVAARSRARALFGWLPELIASYYA